MIASDIIDRCRIVLQDVIPVRWADAEFWKWISDAQRVVALVRPDSCAINYQLTLAANSKQTLPLNGIRLLDVIRNIEPGGDPGRAVRIVDREALDAQNPNWHSATGAQIINVVFDNRDPLNFYTYPKGVAGAKLEILYSKNPTDVTANGSPLGVPDIYGEAILNYVLFRAYSKDADFAANAGLAQGYLQLFTTLLGIKTSKDFAFSPDANRAGLTPNAVAVQSGGV